MPVCRHNIFLICKANWALPGIFLRLELIVEHCPPFPSLDTSTFQEVTSPSVMMQATSQGKSLGGLWTPLDSFGVEL